MICRYVPRVGIRTFRGCYSGAHIPCFFKTTLDRVVTDQVLTVPSTACKGLREMITRRADEVAELKDEVSALEEDCVHR